jgi:hypothetical protein
MKLQEPAKADAYKEEDDNEKDGFKVPNIFNMKELQGKFELSVRDINFDDGKVLTN